MVITIITISLVLAGQSLSKGIGRGEVWVVYFGSNDCPVCEHIKPLLDSLVSDHDIRIKSYDITRPEDYQVFAQIESVHSDNKFSVPLIIVGENILIGEKQIQNNLKGLVDRYRRNSGAPLPYLGAPKSDMTQPPSHDGECVECRDKGRPPSVQSELRKLKVIIDRFIE